MKMENGDTVTAASVLGVALTVIESDKPGDKSEEDRKYAIIRTEIEKLIAICEGWENEGVRREHYETRQRKSNRGHDELSPEDEE